MSKSDSHYFIVYRYQILPLTTAPQIKIAFAEEEILTIPELIEQKNKIFYDVLIDSTGKFLGRGYGVIDRREYDDGRHVLLRLGVEKKFERDTEDFTKETIPTYPNAIVFFDNDPEKQTILIENNLDAFSDTNTIMRILSNTLNAALLRYELRVYIEAAYDVSEFWKTIEKYRERITMLRFELIRPNMPNISKSAVEAIKLLKSNTNTHKTKLSLHAPKGGTLENITPENEEISALANYSLEGGGKPPVIKVKKIRHFIKTTKSERHFEIDGFEGTPEALAELLKNKT